MLLIAKTPKKFSKRRGYFLFQNPFLRIDIFFVALTNAVSLIIMQA